MCQRSGDQVSGQQPEVLPGRRSGAPRWWEECHLKGSGRAAQKGLSRPVGWWITTMGIRWKRRSFSSACISLIQTVGAVKRELSVTFSNTYTLGIKQTSEVSIQLKLVNHASTIRWRRHPTSHRLHVYEHFGTGGLKSESCRAPHQHVSSQTLLIYLLCIWIFTLRLRQGLCKECFYKLLLVNMESALKT